MNITKNCNKFKWMEWMEVIILLIIYLVECVPNKTEDKNLNVFDVIKKRMNQKY